LGFSKRAIVLQTVAIKRIEIVSHSMGSTYRSGNAGTLASASRGLFHCLSFDERASLKSAFSKSREITALQGQQNQGIMKKIT